MKKRELLQRAWISIKRRLPPKTDEDLLVWNWFTGHATIMKGMFAHQKARQELAGNGKALGVDGRISHWMSMPGPHGEKQDEASRIWDGAARRKRGGP